MTPDPPTPPAGAPEEPAPTSPAGSPPAAGLATAPGRRRRWTGPVAGALVGALLIWYAIVLLSSAAPAPISGGPVRFVPDDGSRFPATFSQHDDSGPAMVENTRLHGLDITSAMSGTAFAFLDPPSGGLDRADWWREAVVPGDPRQPTRYRIRSFDADGIWLRVQDWEGLGISLEHLLELPADVRAGRTWTSSGRAVAEPTTVQRSYHRTSSARPATDPKRAAAGCLSVSSTTEVTGGPSLLTWRESTLWCPGAGATVSEGTFRGVSYRLEPEAAAPPDTDDLTIGPSGTGDVSGWTVRGESLLNGDATFGGRPAELSPLFPPVVAANGVIALAPGDDTLTGLVPTTPGTLWGHWWAHPGGSITAVAEVGRLLAVVTTRRELVVYGAGGRWLWSSPLADVAVAPPLELPGDRIAVATVGGQVTVYDARTGAPSWSERLTYGVFSPLATDGLVLVVADAGPNVTAFDLATGRQRWQNDAGSPFGATLAVADGSVAVAGNGSVMAYDARTGARRWYRTVGLGLDQVVLNGDQLLVALDSSGLESWAMADGHISWSSRGIRPAPESRCRLTDGPDGAPLFLAFRGTELVTVDGSGRVRRSWPLPGVSGSGTADELRADCAAGRIWVTAYGSGGAADLGVESIGPA